MKSTQIICVVPVFNDWESLFLLIKDIEQLDATNPSYEFKASKRTLDYLTKNYITKNSYTGFQAWTRHYVLKDSSNAKIVFKQSEYQRLISDANVKSNIGRFNFNNNTLNVNGWAIIEGVNSQKTQISILLLNKLTGYRVESINLKRPDVKQKFGLNYNAEHSGFRVETSLKYLPKGEYQLGILLENSDHNRRSLVVIKEIIFKD